MEPTTPPIPTRYIDLIEAIAGSKTPYYQLKLKDLKEGQEILAASREEQARLVVAMLHWLENGGRWPHSQPIEGRQGLKVMDLVRNFFDIQVVSRDRTWKVRGAMFELLGRKLPFDHADVVTLLAWSGNQEQVYWFGAGQMIRVIENYLKDHSLTPEIQKGIAMPVSERWDKCLAWRASAN